MMEDTIDENIFQKPKVAILTSRFPFPLEKGDKLRLYYQILELKDQFDIYLLAVGEHDSVKSDFEKILPLVKEIHFFRLDLFQRYYAVLKGFFSGLPLQVLFFYNKKIETQISKILEGIQPDHVYCQLARMAHYTRGLTFIKTLDYMDAFGVGMERRANVAKGLAKWLYKREAFLMKKYEISLLGRFDFFTFISAQDRNHIVAASSDKNVYITPNGIDSVFFDSPMVEKKFDLIFVGNMGYLPNIEAAEFLVNKILPKLTLPATLLIAGARPGKRVMKLQGPDVKIGGWYNDIREAYCSGKIFVAPLWSGTGQQNKILEALALGLPCITTSAVNEAIHATDGLNILLADDVNSFVKKINLLISSHETILNIGNEAQKFVKQNYSWKTNATTMADIFSVTRQ